MSTFGEELRRERELRRISLRDVAEATKINLRYLEALESNQFSELPGGVFNRGFVRAYSEFIGIDAEMMVNAYLHEEGSLDLTPGDAGMTGKATRNRQSKKAGAGRSRPAAGPDAPTPATAGEAGSGNRSRRLGAWILVVVAALAIAAAVWWTLGAPGWKSAADPAIGVTQQGFPAGFRAGSPAGSDGR